MGSSNRKRAHHHILKPSTGEFDGLAENEHFCLRLAANLGLSVAKSYVEYFGEHPVFVVKRYDRIEDKRSQEIIRVHQEDFCQALAISPHLKYQNQGGPSPADVVGLLRDYSSKPSVDIWRFIEALALNLMIAGTDGHAKNYSLMIAPNQKVRLAPFYDMISSLPYPAIVNPRKAKLAMKIGGEYRISHIGRQKWEQLAGEIRLKPTDLMNRIESLALKIPTAIKKTTEELFESKLEHPVIKTLATEIEISSVNSLKY